MANLKVSFLDVGHGAFLYCETPLGDRMLIDCGSGDVVPTKFLNNIEVIDELQITHPHTDHFDDIIGISSKTIKSLRCPDTSIFKDEVIGWKNSDAKKIKKLKELEKSIPSNNDSIRTNDSFSHLVWSSPVLDSNDPNTSSLITLISYNGFKILMGGDLPKEGWEKMLDDASFKEAIKGTSILKASHHGRADGFCDELFEVISPLLCIASDKELEKDNKDTSAVSQYTAAVKKNKGGLEFVRVSDNVSVGIRYVLTTRNDGSIFMNIQGASNYQIQTYTNWI